MNPEADLKLIRCEGCGALVPDMDAPTHAYIGAAAGCWALHGELQTRSYVGIGGGNLMIDTYAVQHPGVPSRRSIQSVAVHLIGLHLALEQGADFKRVVAALAQSAHHDDVYVWLDPPTPNGTLTVVEVAKASTHAELSTLIRQWAAGVWESWAPYHKTVRRWAQIVGVA